MQSIRFIGRYLAIGILVGIGIYAVDEIHWRLFGSERVAMVQQSMERIAEVQESIILEPLLNSPDEKQSESPSSCVTSSCSDLMRPTPYFVNGKIQGYRVYAGSDRQTFISLGLRPGDLVTEIDGQPLVDSTVAIELFGKAASGQPVQLSVLRGDTLEKIEVKVE